MSDAPRSRPLHDAVHFLGNFVRNPSSIGSVAPSSRYLAEALAGDLKLEDGDLVLEYGPGTGPMTAVIDRQMAEVSGARYLGIELNHGFIKKLEQRHPHLAFEHGSVEHVAEILERRDLPRVVKTIISGLPFASLPAAVQTGVVAGICEVLAESGEFRTFQYAHAYGMKAARRFRGMMDEHFKSFERSKVVLRNLPPAYVLTYRP